MSKYNSSLALAELDEEIATVDLFTSAQALTIGSGVVVPMPAVKVVMVTGTVTVSF